MRQEEMDGLLKRIRNSAEDMPTPERLEPEQMMEELKQIPLPEEAGTNEGKDRRGWWKKPVRYGAAAAAVALTLFTAGQFQDAGIQEGPGSMTMASADGTQAEAGAQAGTEAQAGAQAGTGGAEDQPSLEEPEEAVRYTAQSYEQIYKLIKPYVISSDTRWIRESGLAAGAVIEDGRVEAASPEMAGISDTAAQTKFSGTNIQVEGVDEGDVVKTDGRYIYTITEDTGRIQIIEAVEGQLKKMGAIEDTSTATISKAIREFYINGDTLSVIRQASISYEIAPTPQYRPEDVGGAIVRCHDYSEKYVTYLETYDISDREAPKLLGTVTQDGTYKSSRRVGDHVYLFTSYYAGRTDDVMETETYIPRVNQKVIPYESIYIPDHVKSSGYVVITATDSRNPETPVSEKAVLADGSCFYVSQDHIYIGTTRYDGRASQYDYTELMKLSYQDGRVLFRAHANVDGYLNDQFSMDEYQGKLRLVTTLSHNNGKTTNSLIILDEKLEKIGEIGDLAPDEQVYSARFMGETGYFVTFRNMDPLFSVDLSDPADPKILGELKITGFSEYLHSYEEDLLLGIGREIDPDTGIFKGLKLSMFDVSSPEDVKETRKKVEADYEYSPAWNNHKAVIISSERNLTGFAVEHYDKTTRTWKNQYVVYSYDRRDGFTQEMVFDLLDYNGVVSARGLYIGSWFYVVENNRATSFGLEDFRQKEQLKY